MSEIEKLFPACDAVILDLVAPLLCRPVYGDLATISWDHSGCGGLKMADTAARP